MVRRSGKRSSVDNVDAGPPIRFPLSSGSSSCSDSVLLCGTRKWARYGPRVCKKSGGEHSDRDRFRSPSSQGVPIG